MTKPITPEQARPKPKTFAETLTPKINRLLRRGGRVYEHTSYARQKDADALAQAFREHGWQVTVVLVGRQGRHRNITTFRWRFAEQDKAP